MLTDVSSGAPGAGSGVTRAEAVAGGETVGGKFATALSAIEELQNGEGTEADTLLGQEIATAEGVDIDPVILAALPGFGASPVADDAPLAGGDAELEPDALKPMAPVGLSGPHAGSQDGDADNPARAGAPAAGIPPQGAAGDSASQPGENQQPAEGQDTQPLKTPIESVAGTASTGSGVNSSVALLPGGEGVQVPIPAGTDIKPAPVGTTAVATPIIPSNDNAGSPGAVLGSQALPVQTTPQVLTSEQSPATDRRWKTELPEVARSSLFKDASAAGQSIDAASVLPVEGAPDEVAGVTALRPAPSVKSDMPDMPLVPKLPTSGEPPYQTQDGLSQAIRPQDGAAATLFRPLPEQVSDAELDLQNSRTRPDPAGANNETLPRSVPAGARADNTASQQLTPAQLFGKPSANNALQQQDINVPDIELSDADTLSIEARAAKPSSPEGKTGPAVAGASNIIAAGSGATPAAGTGVAAGPAAAALVAGEPVVVEHEADPILMFDPKVSGQGSDVLKTVRQDALNMPSQAQSGQVATQVAAEISRNLKNGNTRFQMRFDPPELGRVEVNMRVAADGSVQAHLIVDRPETLDMFLRDQRGLERALEAAGLKTDSNDLTFTLKDQGGQNSQFSKEQRDENAGGEASNSTGNDDEEETADQIVHLNIGSDRSGLDIRV